MISFRASPKAGKRKVNALIYVTPWVGPEVLPHLLSSPDLNLKVVCDTSKEEFQEHLQDGVDLSRVQWIENSPQDPYKNTSQMKGHKLARWADFVFVVMDASMVALMLSGLTTDVILHVLRCWDTSKRIVMLPEMSKEQWRNPIWEKHLSTLQKKWDWVNVLTPALWAYTTSEASLEDDDDNLDEEYEITWDWDGSNEIIEAIHSEAQSVLRLNYALSLSRLTSKKPSSSKPSLPPELWTNILDHLGDWELATALGIYTHIPVPADWQRLIPATPNARPYTLEYTILTQPLSKVQKVFTSSHAQSSPPTTLSQIATRLIFRFSMTDLLTYLALHQKDVFWTSFGLALLPHKASLIFNSPSILQWWKDCPAVIKKEYGPEAMDGASRAGFVEVLEWWLHSGLPLWYTEKALENASAKGHVEVLEWWRSSSLKLAGTDRELPLKVGKSILLAAQSGRTEAVAWWDASGIPYAHEDGVARLASQHGHVSVLELWRSLKGSKMIFDNQVLVGATKNGHAGVLEWWKDASRKWGLRVEYKMCDIEEAMEDAVGGGGEGEVREWWSHNGLNLGLDNREWMRVKTL